MKLCQRANSNVAGGMPGPESAGSLADQVSDPVGLLVLRLVHCRTLAPLLEFAVQIVAAGHEQHQDQYAVPHFHLSWPVYG